MTRVIFLQQNYLVYIFSPTPKKYTYNITRSRSNSAGFQVPTTKLAAEYYYSMRIVMDSGRKSRVLVGSGSGPSLGFSRVRVRFLKVDSRLNPKI